MSLDGSGFPKDGKPAPHQAEGNHEDVGDVQAQPPARLTAPKEPFAGIQFTLDFGLGFEITRVHLCLFEPGEYDGKQNLSSILLRSEKDLCLRVEVIDWRA